MLMVSRGTGVVYRNTGFCFRSVGGTRGDWIPNSVVRCWVVFRCDWVRSGVCWFHMLPRRSLRIFCMNPVAIPTSSSNKTAAKAWRMRPGFCTIRRNQRPDSAQTFLLSVPIGAQQNDGVRFSAHSARNR